MAHIKPIISSVLITLFTLMTSVAVAEDQPTLVNIKRMSLDTALTMAKAAIVQCRKEGVQVSVTVVDRGGHPQVMLRDVLAQDFSIGVGQKKAYTAMTFNLPTASMEGRFTDPFSIGKIDSIVISKGGLPINAGGNIIGGIGVSGAPSGDIDERCAQAGIDAIQDELEMAAE